MDEIKKCTEALLEAIRNSADYQDYEEARLAVAADPEKKKIVNEFRRRVYDIQNGEDSDGAYEKMEKLEQDFYIVRRDRIMNQFLQSELGLCRIIQNISQELVQVADFGIEDFADAIRL